MARWYAETFSDKNVVISRLEMLINSYLVVRKNVSVHFGGTQKKICYLVVRIEEKVGNPCTRLYLYASFFRKLCVNYSVLKVLN